MDKAKLVWQRHMSACNLHIERREALVYVDGEIVGINTELLTPGFAELYANLTSVGYAKGWIV